MPNKFGGGGGGGGETDIDSDRRWKGKRLFPPRFFKSGFWEREEEEMEAAFKRPESRNRPEAWAGRRTARHLRRAA